MSSPGRPRVFKGMVRLNIARTIRKHGLTRSLPILRERGINCSMAVLRDVAEEHSIPLRRGRPNVDKPVAVKPRKVRNTVVPVEAVQVSQVFAEMSQPACVFVSAPCFEFETVDVVSEPEQLEAA